MPSLQWRGAHCIQHTHMNQKSDLCLANQKYMCTQSPLSTLQAWWRLDADAPWRSNRPGPTPFKDCERPFDILPGGTSPSTIKPDIVHTFHLGFGVDLAASIVVWLCKLGVFDDGNPRQGFDEKLALAYSAFREFCHTSKRFTACDVWSKRKFGMSSTFI